MPLEIRHEWRDGGGVRLHCGVADASHWIVHEKPELVCSEIERFAGMSRG